MNPRLFTIIGLTGIMLCCILFPAESESKDRQAKIIRAAFILQFSKYVAWPDGSINGKKNRIILCLMGQDPFGSLIDQANSKFHDRKIKIRRIQSIQNIQDCHILFVCPDRQQNMADIVTAAGDLPILIIGNEKEFLDKGGMINFRRVGTKIRFDIHLDNSEKKKLQVSSKLLKVANKVVRSK